MVRLMRLWPALIVTLLPVQMVRADDVLVFAAASLQGPLDRAADAWETATGHQVTLSYAGSAVLAH